MRSGHPATSAAGALATVLAGLLLAPLFDGLSWAVPTAVAVLAVFGIGLACRSLRVPAPLHALIEAIGLVWLMTMMFAQPAAALGFLPGPAALAELRLLTSQGLAQSAAAVPPVDVTQQMIVLAVGGLGMVAITVDVIGVTLRMPALAGIPLVAVYAVPAAVLRGGVPWLLFPVVACGWLGFMAVSQRESLREWSSGPPRRLASLGAGARRLGVVAVAVALAVPALAPGLAEPIWGTSAVADPDSPSDGSAPGLGTVRIDPFASIKRSIIAEDDRQVLTYRSPSGDPAYLRLVALDYFDGETWRDEPPETLSRRVPLSEPLLTNRPDWVPAVVLDEATGPTEPYLIAVGDLGNTHLPLPYPAVQVTGADERTTEAVDRGGWLWEPASRTAVNPSASAAGLAYQATVATDEPSIAQLRAATGTVPEELRADLDLPFPLPDIVRQTARDVAGRAATDYDRAVALQNYFTRDGGFSYSTDVTSDDDSSFLEQFLTDKVGYCQQYAGTMAVMARLLGIPSRVIIGFSPGEQQDDGSHVVSVRDAHAWPELWFEGAGWVRFEPTPRAETGTGVASPPYVPAPTATGGSAAEPSASPRPNRLDPAESGGEVDQGAGSAAAEPDAWRRTAIALSVVLGLVALTVPGIARAMRRRRRLAHGPSGAWAELRDTAYDLGLPWSESDSMRAAGRALTGAARLGGTARESLDAIVRSAERERYASPGTTYAHDLSDEVREVTDAVRGRCDRWVRVRSVVWPRSLWRRG